MISAKKNQANAVWPSHTSASEIVSNDLLLKYFQNAPAHFRTVALFFLSIQRIGLCRMLVESSAHQKPNDFVNLIRRDATADLMRKVIQKIIDVVFRFVTKRNIQTLQYRDDGPVFQKNRNPCL